MNKTDTTLAAFVRESNSIEGIIRDPTADELEATRLFLQEDTLQLSMLKGLVKVYQPDAIIRDREGLDVRVGQHIPPEGSPKIPIYVERMFSRINGNFGYTPYQAHHDYETLYPFTDGNGRSGRAVWAWHMKHHGLDPFALPFLHQFYYQALDAGLAGQPLRSAHV